MVWLQAIKKSMLVAINMQCYLTLFDKYLQSMDFKLLYIKTNNVQTISKMFIEAMNIDLHATMDNIDRS